MSKTSPQESPTRGLTIRYLAALTLIASLVIGGQVILQFLFASQASDSRVINIAGRQRMLSQSLAKSALAFQHASAGSPEWVTRREELEETLELLERSHIGLQQGDALIGLPGNNSETVIMMFVQIESHFQALRNATERLLALPPDSNPREVEELVLLIFQHEVPFLQGMNEIVFQYDSEGRARVQTVSLVEQVFLLVTLLTLAGEAILIFNPVVRYLQDTFNRLFDTQYQLYQREETLLQLSENQNKQAKLLETIIEVSRQFTRILDLDDLLISVVNHLQQNFNYTHVQIYLWDTDNTVLKFQYGTGTAGQKLRDIQHTIQPGFGVIGTVGQTGRPLLVSAVNQSPQYQPISVYPDTQSELGVPLVVQGKEVLGVLDVQSNVVNHFNNDDLSLLLLVADQVGVAIENARLFAQVRQERNDIEQLNQQLVRDAWRDIQRKADATSYIFDPQQGSQPMETGPEPPLWLPPMTTAIHANRPIIVEQDVDPQETNEAEQSTSVLAVPLVLRDQVIGVIGLERPQSEAWQDDDQTAIQVISDQIALALDAARLARETRQRAAREEIVANLTQAVWSGNEIEEVMQNSVSRLGESFKANKVVLRLGDERTLRRLGRELTQ